MLSDRIIALSETLLQRPDLRIPVCRLLVELADCLRHLEQSEVPAHLQQPVPIPAGVVRLSDVRRARA